MLTDLGIKWLNTFIVSYKKQIEDAQEQLLRLEQQKKDVERQMRGWVQIIEGLRMLSERPAAPTTEVVSIDPETPSLPNKVLAILAKLGEPVGATKIRDQLIINRAVDASTKNLLINIHTTLKRLIRVGQVEEVPVNDGSKLYRFVSPMERAIKAPYVSNTLATNARAAAETMKEQSFQTPISRMAAAAKPMAETEKKSRK
jgi:hypothetical protein